MFAPRWLCCFGCGSHFLSVSLQTDEDGEQTEKMWHQDGCSVWVATVTLPLEMGKDDEQTEKCLRQDGCVVLVVAVTFSLFLCKRMRMVSKLRKCGIEMG